MRIVRLSQRVLVGQWPEWPSSAVSRERTQRCWATRTTGFPDVSSPWKTSLHPREIYASGGGLLVAPIWSDKEENDIDALINVNSGGQISGPKMFIKNRIWVPPLGNSHTMRQQYKVVNPLECRGNYSATLNNMKLIHWPLMGGLLHLVQWGGAWAGPQPAQAPPRCIKCNRPPIYGQRTNHRSNCCPLLCGVNVPIKG